MTMKQDYTDLLSMKFLPLSEVKATLSEQVKKTQGGIRRIAITSNGRPTAVLLAYEDYLRLARACKISAAESTGGTIDFEVWKKGQEQRKEISASIDKLFDSASLTRKGQKPYKKAKLDEFTDSAKKRPD